VRLNHLHLHVRSLERARDFYTRYFGFSEHARHGEILFLRDAPDGVDLALAPSARVEPFPAWFHFGFRLPDAQAVRALHSRMAGDRIEIRVALQEFPDFVFFRCADPDGREIEVYWE
jgi:catechol 2,3-dioxygenase-like lactoylglutathione lyase family enzyme